MFASIYETRNRVRLAAYASLNPATVEVVNPGYRKPTLLERISFYLLSCRDHQFGWPIRSYASAWAVIPPAGFDSYQTCSGCGAERFYDSLTMTPGSLYIRTGHSSVVHNL